MSVSPGFASSLTNAGGISSMNFVVKLNVALFYRHSPQIRQLHTIKNKAAIGFTCNLQCKAIAALFFIPYFRP